MRKPIQTAIASLLVLGLVACGGETTSQLDAENNAAVDEIESEIDRFADELEAAEVEDELRSAWESVEAELTQGVEALRSGEAVDTDAIQREFDEFQQTLDASEIEAALQEAWTELRANFDRLMTEMG